MTVWKGCCAVEGFGIYDVIKEKGVSSNFEKMFKPRSKTNADKSDGRKEHKRKAKGEE